MKKLILIAILIALCSIIWAESEQIVYYDSNRVLENSKDLQDAQKNLENDITSWEQEIAEIDNNIEVLTAEYDEKRLTLLESGRLEALEKIEELNQLRKNKIEEIYGENGSIINRNNELLRPIMDKLNTILENIAVDNNYSMILDAASGAVGYAKNKLDITEDIIDEMEKTLDVEDTKDK